MSRADMTGLIGLFHRQERPIQTKKAQNIMMYVLAMVHLYVGQYNPIGYNVFSVGIFVGDFIFNT